MIAWIKSFFSRHKCIDFQVLFDEYDALDVGEDRRDAHLVASGSGLRLYAFLLSIYVLHLLGFRFVRGTGTSGGALIMAILFSHYDPNATRDERRKALQKVVKIVMDVDLPSLLDPSFYLFRFPFRLMGMIRGKKILKRLKAELPARFETLYAPVEVVAFQVNLVDPRTRVIGSGRLPEAVMASMSIPLLFSPVTRDKMVLVDGGWQMNLALPDGGEDVIGLAFTTGEDDRVLKIENNIHLIFKLMDGAMDEGMRRAVEDAPKAELIHLSTDIGGLDFFLTDDQKIQGMRDGADSVLSWSQGDE